MTSSEGISMKKRKLSISAEVATGDSEGQIKRVKSQRESDIEPVSESKSHSPTAEASDGPDDKEPGSDSDDDARGEDNTRVYNDMGPTIFYLYGDGLMSILVEEEDHTIIRLKSSVDRAWKDLVARHGSANHIPHANELPDDDGWSYAHDMAHWHICVQDEEDRETRGARALKKAYDELAERERDDEFHWWYEVVMQRQEPKGAEEPALQVLMSWEYGSPIEGKEYEGVWWFTGVRWADEAEPALKYHGNNLPYIPC